MIGQTTKARQQAAPPKIKFVPITGWGKGRYSSRDIDRMPIDGLRVTENVQLDQDGTVTPRPGTKLYGVQPTGTVIGQVFEYVRMNTSVTPNTPETWMIWLENRSGTGYVVTNKDGGAHTVVTGKTYTITGAKPHFEQVYGQVIITTGVDFYSKMDVQTQVITPMVALSAPVGVSAVATGISGSTYTLRYRYTAANQGETAGSTAVTVGVSRLRESWDGTTQYVTFTGNRVSGATRYNIYVSDQAGYEYFLDSIVDPGSGTTFSYTDTGTIALTTTRIAPAGDSTAGAKTTRSTNVKGQIYMVGDTDNPGRIWFGGNMGVSALDFSSYNGGGWVEPNKGGKDFPAKIVPFRDGKGTPMAACLSKGTNGAGKRYLLQPSSTTLGETVITYMAVTEDNGAEGTDSPDGVAFIDDALIYPSRTGFKSSTTKPSIQNIISTSGISDNIAPDVASLNSTAMEKCVQVTNDRRIYWALPYASTTNNQIWVLDLRQKGAWMTPWNIAADWLWLYADNTLGTKMLGLVNNKFVEIDTATKTSDVGVAFPTNISTGGLKINEDGTFYGSIIDVTFIFERPEGNINLAVDVYTEDGVITFSDVMTSSANKTIGAWGRYGWGAAGWGALSPRAIPVPISSTTARRAWTIPVDEESNMVVCSVNTLDAGISYQWAEVIVRYVPLGFKEIDNV